MKFSEIIRENNNFELKLISKQLPINSINILTNITINQIKPILEYTLRSNNQYAKVKIGEYDNIIQDSVGIDQGETVIIFWELLNISENFYYEIEGFSEEEFNIYMTKVKNELLLLISNLSKHSLVLFNKFSSSIFSSYQLKRTKFQIFVEELNSILDKHKSSNMIIIDIDKLLLQLSIGLSIDLRGYYTTKTLYTIDFLKIYVNYISTFLMTTRGIVKKAIIFDCDNTLWGGVIGEDGIENIQLDETKKKGIYYKQVQILAKQLFNKGVILGICSKNNYDDVIEVLVNNPKCILKSENFIVKKINWTDKASNLIEIATELNIGIDSLIFIDDSEFEINLIKEKLPEIQTFHVPENLYEYPNLFFKKIYSLFYKENNIDDTIRISSYKDNLERARIKDQFSNIDDYIKSLGISIDLDLNNTSNINRVAQLTQKTNQFNLTTKRYTEEQIKILTTQNNAEIITIDVKDKFGVSGLTGTCILLLDYENNLAEIDTFLLSCRVLGRNIEITFLEEVINFLKKKKISKIKSYYNKTSKNKQVECFYENNGFNVIKTTDLSKEYEYSLDKEIQLSKNINYINITWKIELNK